MSQSESIDQLAGALVKVQATLKPALKDSANPYFKSSYADLESCWSAAREALTSNGLAVVQVGETMDEVQYLKTILVHTSGQWISGRFRLNPVKDDPQGAGSAITYYRRYALAAMIGLVQSDDDGNHASQQDHSDRLDAMRKAIESGLDIKKAAAGWEKIKTQLDAETYKRGLVLIKEYENA